MFKSLKYLFFLTFLGKVTITQHSADVEKKYIWYTVLSGQGNVGVKINSGINITSLDLATYNDINKDGLVTMEDFSNRLLSPSDATMYFGKNFGPFVNAVAFQIDKSALKNFCIKDGYLVPKSTGKSTDLTITDVVYKIKRLVL